VQTFIVLAIVVLAVVMASLAGRAAWKRSVANSRSRAKEGPPEGRELAAVITAAVSAASGMDAGSFGILDLRPSSARSAIAAAPFGQRGFNTPAWGHVERLTRGEQA
jgi:Na+-transporting methylmalonyl-CoA/oxaloacetate decarboxylase gamma subunit